MPFVSLVDHLVADVISDTMTEVNQLKKAHLGGLLNMHRCGFCQFCFDAFCSERLLSYSSTDSTAYSNAHFGQNSDIIIALDDVACTVYESRLIDCPYDSHIADCTHSEDAGVQCVPRELSSHKCISVSLESILVYLQSVLMAVSD